MTYLLRTVLRSLMILIVAIGPVQAQIMVACSMMDTVLVECCCDDHQASNKRTDSSRFDTEESSEPSCCEQVVEIQVDNNAAQSTRVAKPLEPDINSDPPQALVATLIGITLLQRVVRFGLHPRLFVAQSGSDIYLITQRLRI